MATLTQKVDALTAQAAEMRDKIADLEAESAAMKQRLEGFGTIAGLCWQGGFDEGVRSITGGRGRRNTRDARARHLTPVGNDAS